jgi:hypothetical protein
MTSPNPTDCMNESVTALADGAGVVSLREMCKSILEQCSVNISDISF